MLVEEGAAALRAEIDRLRAELVARDVTIEQATEKFDSINRSLEAVTSRLNGTHARMERSSTSLAGLPRKIRRGQTIAAIIASVVTGVVIIVGQALLRALS